MDHSYQYIASLTREPFLFYEMRSTAKLMVSGLSDEAVVKEIVDQNLFQYPTEKSITRMAKACIKRLQAMEDDSLIFAIASQPTDVAKQICLYALMKQSRLVYEFMLTVIGEKYRLRDTSFYAFARAERYRSFLERFNNNKIKTGYCQSTCRDRVS